MQKRGPETKDNSKQKLERLTRTNRQLKQQLENHEEAVKSIKGNHTKELEKAHNQLDQTTKSNTELKNVLTVKETEIIELQRRLKAMGNQETDNAEVVKRHILEPNLESWLSTPIGKGF